MPSSLCYRNAMASCLSSTHSVGTCVAHRQGPGANALCVDLVLENQVPPSDVELHIEPSIEPAPPAHACLKSIELDSDADSDSDEDIL